MERAARAASNRGRGFTLLEVMISTLLLVGCVVSIAWALNLGLLASADLENVNLGLAIAQDKMEEIKNTAFGSVSSSGPTADSNFSAFNTTVTVTGTDPKQVAVAVAWNAQGGSSSVTLTTQVASY